MGRRATTAALLVGPALLLGPFFLYPLAVTLESALEADAWRWASGPFVRERVLLALVQALLSVALTFTLALPLALLHHRTRVPFSRAHLALHAAPFVLPVFVIIFGIQGVLGPRGLVASLTGLNPLGWLGPLGAVVAAHAYYNYGFAARILHAALARRPERLEEAARTLGASRRGAALRVTLPLLLPTFAGVSLLVFLFSFTSFGVVLFLGGGPVQTLETMLFRQLGGAFPRYDRAAVLGVVQLLLNVALFLGYLHLRRSERGLEHRGARPAPAAGPAARAVAWGSLGFGLVPIATVLLGGFRVSGAWTLEAWRALTLAAHPAHLAGFSLVRATGLSLVYAACAMLLALGLTLALVYGVRRLGGSWRRFAETLATLPLGTSSLLIGLGYLLAFGAGDLLDLRGSAGVIVLAHTLVAFPFTARILLPALDLHDVRLDEAAALLGAPPREVVRRVHLPLLAGPLAVAAGLAAAMSFGDFGASVVLMRPDNMALSVWIARHDVPFDPLMHAQAVALSGLLLVLTTGALLLTERFRGPMMEV